MSAPKSVVKIKKDGVHYESFEEQAEYYLFELSRAALRDVGKFIRKKFKDEYYKHFKKHTGEGGRAVVSKVWSNRDTKYPRVQVGLPHSARGKVSPGFYAFFQEFGSSKTPKLGLLTHAVQDNIAEIVKIESQYLSGLNEEAERLKSLIDEDEYLDEDEL